MELGSIVCTARVSRCAACPLADDCAWRAAGYPDNDGEGRAAQKRVAQKRFEGSDSQVRGLILAELRASHIPVSRAGIEAVWGDQEQRERALAGLIADGLVTGTALAGYEL